MFLAFVGKEVVQTVGSQLVQGVRNISFYHDGLLLFSTFKLQLLILSSENERISLPS